MQIIYSTGTELPHCVHEDEFSPPIAAFATKHEALAFIADAEAVDLLAAAAEGVCGEEPERFEDIA